MDYSTILRESWRVMLRDYRSGVFTPRKEADVRCYLYHLLLERIGDARKIHAEWGVRGGSIDLMIAERLPVEIKLTRVRGRLKPAKGWRRDLRKLSELDFGRERRRPFFCLFLVRGRKETVAAPLPPEEIPPTFKDAAGQLTDEARRLRINVLLPY